MEEKLRDREIERESKRERGGGEQEHRQADSLHNGLESRTVSNIFVARIETVSTAPWTLINIWHADLESLAQHPGTVFLLRSPAPLRKAGSSWCRASTKYWNAMLFLLIDSKCA